LELFEKFSRSRSRDCSFLMKFPKFIERLSGDIFEFTGASINLVLAGGVEQSFFLRICDKLWQTKIDDKLRQRGTLSLVLWLKLVANASNSQVDVKNFCDKGVPKKKCFLSSDNSGNCADFWILVLEIHEPPASRLRRGRN
jgi:hypothetical protein